MWSVRPRLSARERIRAGLLVEQHGHHRLRTNSKSVFTWFDIIRTFCAWPASTPQQGLRETEAGRHGIIELTIAA
jgi:hypothetical protein